MHQITLLPLTRPKMTMMASEAMAETMDVSAPAELRMLCSIKNKTRAQDTQERESVCVRVRVCLCVCVVGFDRGVCERWMSSSICAPRGCVLW